jgi:NAD(P)-dependent dehydrogenase (short-subunit alcohol dehydrogenase family)
MSASTTNPNEHIKPVAMVTGALAGIGRATAFAFGQSGYRVVVSGRRDAAGQELVEELRQQGVEAEFVKADVRYEAEVKHLVDATINRFGRLDAAVNNAGTDGKFGPISDQDEESYKAVLTQTSWALCWA